MGMLLRLIVTKENTTAAVLSEESLQKHWEKLFRHPPEQHGD
jgi:hypothetical protein